MKYFRSTTFENRGHRAAGSLLTMAMMVTVFTPVGATLASAQLEDLEKPVPTVEQSFTLQGEFVRMAYNNEGFVTLGYRTANNSVGEQWMLLEVGLTLRNDVKEQKLTRDSLTLRTPDGKVVPLASQEAFNKANLRALDRRANTTRDSINYFPVGAKYPCTLNFFADPTTKGRSIAYDEVSLNYQRACVGRLYFHIPDGIEVGQHWLDVKFANSVVQVPLRIFTKEERKEFDKMWKELKREHDAGTK